MILLLIFPRILNNESAFYNAQDLFTYVPNVTKVIAVKENTFWMPSNIQILCKEKKVEYEEYDTNYTPENSPNLLKWGMIKDWSMEKLISECDKLIIFGKGNSFDHIYEKFAWEIGKPCLRLSLLVKHKVMESHFTCIEIHKYKTWITEVKDRDVPSHSKETFIYEFEELQSSNQDYFVLHIYGKACVHIYATSYNWIEDILNNQFSNLYRDTRLDYNLKYHYHYGVVLIDKTLFSFSGYSKCHLEKDCITLEQQFERVNKDENLRCVVYNFGETPKLECFFNDEKQ